LYNKDDAILNPLYYDIEKNNFFRIEGHIGKDHSTVLKDLLDKRQTFNLPFDLVAVSADLLNTNVAKLPECNILDLETDYKLIITDFICRIQQPFCYMTKIPMVKLDPPTLSNTFNQESVSQFSSFKKDITLKTLKTIEIRQKKYVKGNFMNKYCPPLPDTVGKYYFKYSEIQDVISSITPEKINTVVVELQPSGSQLPARRWGDRRVGEGIWGRMFSNGHAFPGVASISCPSFFLSGNRRRYNNSQASGPRQPFTGFRRNPTPVWCGVATGITKFTLNKLECFKQAA
jgi:hypothetical protein